ncbi:MAG: LPS assembly protein LptD, partial [Kangiellaceae bacterium]|nr:LPS assembly protein LptD [Kangiellaceae bacterium]
MSLTSRHIDNTTGEQLLSISLGRKFYFEDAQVALDGNSDIRNNQFSPWLAEVKYRPNKKIEISAFIEWTNDNIRRLTSSKTKLARSQIKFEPIPDHIVNLSHRVRNNSLNSLVESNEEIDLSFAWPINDQWRLVGRWYNDLELNRTSETLFGFEYESCCWAISIVSRRYIDVRLDAFGNPLSDNQVNALDKEFNSGVQFQFVFKGLGDPGRQSISRLLAKSIQGYRNRF